MDLSVVGELWRDFVGRQVKRLEVTSRRASTSSCVDGESCVPCGVFQDVVVVDFQLFGMCLFGRLYLFIWVEVARLTWPRPCGNHVHIRSCLGTFIT